MSIESLNRALSGLYNTTSTAARANIVEEGEKIKRKAMDQAAATGMAGSGAFHKAILGDINKGMVSSIGTMEGNLAANQANALSSIYKDELQRKWEESMYEKQRQDAHSDIWKNLAIGGAGAILGGATGGIGSGIGYTIGKNIFGMPDNNTPSDKKKEE